MSPLGGVVVVIVVVVVVIVAVVVVVGIRRSTLQRAEVHIYNG